MKPSGTPERPLSESELALKKRRGQYFTGMPLARLLASLAEAEKASSIIDPMAGRGDMLAACMEQGSRRPALLGAVEIDPNAHNECAARIAGLGHPGSVVVHDNAFDARLLSKFPARSWSLCITNPPYVRYQSLSRSSEAEPPLPSALEVRNGLIDVLGALSDLDEHDRRLFKILAANYSGLADLAVPSWILCAGLVRTGGMLAMVVPDTWLSRDYALVIKYLLLRWFRILYIVEDSDAVWFPDALVRTTLLVAQRIPRRASAFDWRDEEFLRLRLSGRAADERSVVGRMFPRSRHKEQEFGRLVRRWFRQKTNPHSEFVAAERIKLKDFALNTRQTCLVQPWFTSLEDRAVRQGESNPGALLPPELSAWLGNAGDRISFTVLEDLGVRTGQGLRTGANLFFYADKVGDKGSNEILAPSPIFGINHIQAPKKCVQVVLRKQTELPSGYKVEASSLKGRVLALRGYALPEDIRRCGAHGSTSRRPYRLMADELAKLIRVAATTTVGGSQDNRKIPELSAVAPNVRPADPGDPKSKPRFWYMLPDFAQRHRPDLFVARVNHGHPKVFLSANRAALIDANFVTLWAENGARADFDGLLALLNSSWCHAALELTSTVMGGGALKVEATHVRRLPLPVLNTAQWERLSCLGKKLIDISPEKSQEVLRAINQVVVEALVGKENLDRKLEDLCVIAKRRLQARSGKRRDASQSVA